MQLILHHFAFVCMFVCHTSGMQLLVNVGISFMYSYFFLRMRTHCGVERMQCAILARWEWHWLLYVSSWGTVYLWEAHKWIARAKVSHNYIDLRLDVAANLINSSSNREHRTASSWDVLDSDSVFNLVCRYSFLINSVVALIFLQIWLLCAIAYEHWWG